MGFDSRRLIPLGGARLDSAIFCKIISKRCNNINNIHKTNFVTSAVTKFTGGFGCAINRKICNFYHITSGLRKKIKSNSGLFECQFHEIEVNVNTVCNGPASKCITILCIRTHLKLLIISLL